MYGASFQGQHLNAFHLFFYCLKIYNHSSAFSVLEHCKETSYFITSRLGYFILLISVFQKKKKDINQKIDPEHTVHLYVSSLGGSLDR